MIKLKILIVGPRESGKSRIGNFLSDAAESISKEYRPTQGVRILECEFRNLNVHNKAANAEVEFWDCSGDHKFSGCWPAVQIETSGMVYVYNPEREDHAREMDMFHARFADQLGLQDFQSIVFANRQQQIKEKRTVKLSNAFGRIRQVDVNLDEDGNRIRSEFHSYLGSLISGLQDRREQEELHFMSIRA